MNSDARSLLTLAGAALLALAACRPDFGLPVSVVTEPRVLTVVAEPAEATPGATVHLTVFSGGPSGPTSDGADFAFCTSPRPLVESNVVNGDCLGATSSAVTPIASGVRETDATLLSNACLLFGPDTPPQAPGQPPDRPRDPDVTGGYYEPVRVTLPGDVEAIALVRVHCNLSGASAESAVAFAARYSDNQNPTLSALEVRVDGTVVDPLQVPGGAKVTLHAEWPADSAQAYVVHEKATDALVDARESLRVSWYTTAGLIPVVATGRGADDVGTTTETTWETPAPGTSGTIWAVLRDSRGGSALKSFAFTTR